MAGMTGPLGVLHLPSPVWAKRLLDAKTHAGACPPRYDKKRHPPPHRRAVGKPVPRHRSRHPTLAGETRSDARGASEGARATIKNAPLHRRARACPSPCLAASNARGGNPLGCACGIRGPPRYGASGPNIDGCEGCPHIRIWRPGKHAYRGSPIYLPAS